MLTLLYSKKAAEKFGGVNRAINGDGELVEYTCCGDEIEYGEWKSWYNWDDAIVVGYMLDYSSITYIGTKNNDWMSLSSEDFLKDVIKLFGEK